MSRKRRLSDEDMALWRKVTDKTERLAGRATFESMQMPQSARPRREIIPAPQQLDGKAPPKPASRKVSMDLARGLPESLRRTSIQMDRKTFNRMSRGKLKPEGRLDLHGMTLDRAHGALNRFIFDAHARGKRFVLVITGKGKHRDDGGPIPVRFGVLRHQVPQWLNGPALSKVVMQVSEAHISHGGGGAYYVYLRRQR